MKLFSNTAPATLLLVVTVAYSEAGAQVQRSAALQAMPRELETALALSAAPSHLRDSASVYLLDPSRGYVEARAGTNGFRCFVLRTEWNRPSRPFPDDVFVPECWDAAGTQAILPVDFDAAAMRARGDSPQAVYDEIMRRFADGRYHAPSRAGLAYMLGPVMRTFITDSSSAPSTMVGPHFMFYAPNVTDADIGGRQNTEGPFMLTTGPHGLIFVSAGAARTREIFAQQHTLIEQLCAYRRALCVSKSPMRQ